MGKTRDKCGAKTCREMMERSAEKVSIAGASQAKREGVKNVRMPTSWWGKFTCLSAFNIWTPYSRI